jgi:hypothetical protein
VGNGYAASLYEFGPEVGIGWALGDALVQQQTQQSPHQKQMIYLIKTAWGGQNLAIDFRPPSAGEGNYDHVPPSWYGHRYRDMVTEIQHALQTMSTVLPAPFNTTNTTVSLRGLVWFQGYNDLLDSLKVQEYASNLLHFVQDIQKEDLLGTTTTTTDKLPPHLPNPQRWPIIIGELGMHGLQYHGPAAKRVYGMRTAQAAVAANPRIHGKFVRTAPYMVLNTTETYNGVYHYNGRAVSVCVSFLLVAMDGVEFYTHVSYDAGMVVPILSMRSLSLSLFSTTLFVSTTTHCRTRIIILEKPWDKPYGNFGNHQNNQLS